MSAEDGGDDRNMVQKIKVAIRAKIRWPHTFHLFLFNLVHCPHCLARATLCYIIILADDLVVLTLLLTWTSSHPIHHVIFRELLSAWQIAFVHDTHLRLIFLLLCVCYGVYV